MTVPQSQATIELDKNKKNYMYE